MSPAASPTPGIPLQRLLTRLIWLCMAPLLLLAAWLALDHVRFVDERQEREVRNLVQDLAVEVGRHLEGHVGTLQVLASSPLLDEPARLGEFYRVAQSFQKNFGSHLIVSDVGEPMRMLLNTRVPFGDPLPPLPKPKGVGAAPTALATGQPAVGDSFIGPVAKEKLLAVAVPVVREGRTVNLLVAPIATSHLQSHLDELALPEGWRIALRDGRGDLIAGRYLEDAGKEEESEECPRFEAAVAGSPWSVTLEIPPVLDRATRVRTAIGLFIALLIATLVGALGGQAASRRVGRAVAALTEAQGAAPAGPEIAEIGAVRIKLAAAASEIAASETRFRRLFDSAPFAMGLVGPDARILATNSRFEQLLGYTEADVPSIEAWWCLAYPDPIYRGQVMAGWEGAMAQADVGGLIPAGEYRVVSKDGRERTMQISGVLLPEGVLVAFVDVTEQRAAEAQLRLWAAAFEQAEFGVAISDAQTNRLLTVNRAFAKDRGYLPEELAGKPVHELFPEEVRGQFAGFLPALDQRGHINVESIHVTREGRRFPVQLDVTVLKDAEGRPVNRVAYALDIGDRKQAQEALAQAQAEALERQRLGRLAAINQMQDANAARAEAEASAARLEAALAAMRRSEERLQLVMRSAGAAWWDWEMETQRFTWSPELFALFGLDPARDAAGIESWRRVVHADDREGAADRMKAAVEERRPLVSDYRVILPGGRVRWISALGNTITDAAGNPERMSGICIDITERRQAEEESRDNERRYRNIIHTALDGFWQVDQEARLLEVNEAYCRMSGYSREELLAMRIPDLEAVENADETAAHMRRLVEEGYSRFETRHFRKDRSLLDVEVSTQYRDGQIVAFLRDLTERNLAAGKRSQLEEQVHQMQRLESVGRLAGGVAHDFNNMLGVILGYAERSLLKLDRDQPTYQDLLHIRDAAERSSELTRQLLAFARKQTIEPKALDLNDTLEGLLKMLRRLIGENIQLLWAPQVHLWPVLADPAQLDQILMNLCVNARDAIDGAGKVTIETANRTINAHYCVLHPEASPGDYVVLSVSDTGCGMDQETIEHVFEPFFTTKAAGVGTGLGLATVYGAVKQNGGFINLYSEPGRGTTFAIHLPRHRVEVERTAAEARPQPPARGTETILMVEDEPALLELNREVLEGQGYTLLAAATPAEALRFSKEHPGEIELLITDVVMPEMNGRDLAERLLAPRPRMKCLFMSGYTADVIAPHGVLEQGVWFLQKPFTIRALAAKVRQVLDSDSGGEEQRDAVG